MKSLRLRSVSICCGLLCAALLLVIGAAAAASKFSPPKTAVVSIARVFDGYKKKKDKEDVYQKEMERVKKRLDDRKSEHKELMAEVRQLKESSPLYRDKMHRLFDLEQEIKQIQSTDLKDLYTLRTTILDEIRKEISAEIEAYAKANDVDLVLEREIEAQLEGPAAAFRWPIVHFAGSGLDITREITDRLNARYARKT